MTDQAADWVVRGVMTLVTIFVAMIGRDQKRTEELWTQKLKAITDMCEARFVALEEAQVDEHQLRRDMTRDLGRLDVRLSKSEVRVDEHGRRLDQAGQKSSDLADMTQVLIRDVAAMKGRLS